MRSETHMRPKRDETITTPRVFAAQSILQLANLFDMAGKFERAEMYCDMIDHVPCSPLNITTRDEILGRVLLHQERYKEAIVYLTKGDSGLYYRHCLWSSQ